MSLYSFSPLPLPAAPPAAPGSDFQNLAAAELGGFDGADASVSSGLAAASSFLGDGSTDLAGLGNDIVSAALSLADLINEAASDDLTSYVLAAVDQDSALDSMAGDIDSDLANVLPGVGNWLLQWFFAYLDQLAFNMESWVEYYVQWALQGNLIGFM